MTWDTFQTLRGTKSIYLDHGATLGYSGLLQLVYGLWTEDDSGLPTGPLTITHWTLGLIHVLSLATRTLKTFIYNVLLELGGLPHVLPLAVHLE